MHFELSDYDDTGKPTRVNTDDGFIQCSRRFIKEEDGWMLDQLNANDFPIVRAGRQVEAMINEINALRKEVFHLKQSEKQWMVAAGFGSKEK